VSRGENFPRGLKFVRAFNEKRRGKEMDILKVKGLNIRTRIVMGLRRMKTICLSRESMPLSQISTLIPPHFVKLEIKSISPLALSQGETSEIFHLPEKAILATEKKLFDSLLLKPAKGIEKLLKDIKISNPEVVKFIKSQLNFSFSTFFRRIRGFFLGESFSYYLIYGNRYDEKGIIQQEGVGLVLIFKKRNRTFVVPYDLTPSKPTKLHLEAIFRKDFPNEIVTWPSEVSLDKKVWSAIYEKGKEDKVKVPVKQITKIWPFPLPQGNPIKMARPSKSFKETIKVYLNACRQEKILRLEALGNFLFMLGHGLFQGVILYPILDLAQNLKIWAIIGFLLEFMPVFSAKVNSQVGKEIDRLNAQEAFVESQNKKIPLWDLGARYQTMRTLIKNQGKVALTFFASSLLNFLIYPPIFQKAWSIATSLVSSAYFVFAYLLNELLFTAASLLEELNLYKILEHFKKNSEIKKNFWTIRATHHNIELVTKQLSFAAGFGLCYLTGFDPSLGIGLASAGLALSSAKFLLPIWGREEESVLEIKGAFTRFGQYLKFSPNLRLWVKPESKVNIIGNTTRVIIPNPTPELIKLVLADTNYRWVWRRSFLPFFKKEKIVLRPNRPEDPTITFVKYGNNLSFEEFKQYLELNDFSFLKKIGGKDD